MQSKIIPDAIYPQPPYGRQQDEHTLRMCSNLLNILLCREQTKQGRIGLNVEIVWSYLLGFKDGGLISTLNALRGGNHVTPAA